MRADDGRVRMSAILYLCVCDVRKRVCLIVFDCGGSTPMNEWKHCVATPLPLLTPYYYSQFCSFFFRRRAHWTKYLNIIMWIYSPLNSYQCSVEERKKKCKINAHRRSICKCEMAAMSFNFRFSFFVNSLVLLYAFVMQKCEWDQTMYTRIQLDHASRNILFGECQRETIGRVRHTMTSR